jgi:hypothetical protein
VSPVGFCTIHCDICGLSFVSRASFQVTVMKIVFLFRATGFAAALAAPLLLAPALSAQEQLTPPSDRTYARGAFTNAPVGHRQPRAADIPQTDKSAAELLEERQQADLNRRLRICRGC